MKNIDRKKVAELAGVSKATVTNVINKKPFVKRSTSKKVLDIIRTIDAKPIQGHRRPMTQRKLAHELGLSREVVSMALNNYPDISDETKQKVLAKARATGYRPNYLAKSLSRRKTKTIGLLVNQLNLTFREPVYSMIINGAIEVASSKGYLVGIYHFNATKDGRNYGFMLSDGRCDGGIVIDNALLSQDELGVIEKQQFPTVFANSVFPGRNINTVSGNDLEGARQLANHLIGLGHRRILFTHAHQYPYSQRLEGYRKALAENGIAFDPELVVDYDSPSSRAGMRSWEELLGGNDRVTAICALYDTDAMRLIQELGAKGKRVPEDVSVAGFDDFPFAKFMNPALTTVSTPYIDIGRRAAEMLIDRLEPSGGSARQVMLDSTLVVRSSCGGVK